MCLNFDPGAYVIYAFGFAFETGCDTRPHGHSESRRVRSASHACAIHPAARWHRRSAVATLAARATARARLGGGGHR